MPEITATIDRGPITVEQKSEVISFIVEKFLRDEIKGILITEEGINIVFKDKEMT